MKVCDLHDHSTASDGTLTPSQLVDLAVEKGLSAIALTDHNNIEGLSEFYKRCREKGIDAAGGCEFTTEYEGTELHLIGMFIDEDKFDLVRKYLEELVVAKAESCKITIENLQKAGYPVSYEEFKKLNGEGVKNRVHIANLLIAKGVVKEKQEAFDTLLSSKGQYYVPPKKLDFVKTIDFIHSIGAVAIWAHPLFHVNQPRCDEILAAVKTLDAVEVYYTTYSEDDTAFMQKMVEKYHLIASGGSDFHGDNKPDTFIGVGYGNLKIPYSCYENLIALKRK